MDWLKNPDSANGEGRTQSMPEGEFSLPPKDIMMKALDTWKAAGLPEIDIPKRAKLRLDRS